MLDSDPEKLRHLLAHLPSVATCLAESDSIAAAVRSADVLIGAILIAGSRTPHVVTRAMVESMKPGAAVLDIAIDQGGCVETSRPTTLGEPSFSYNGITHFCVPNVTADMGRSASVVIAQAMLPYLLLLAKHGVDGAIAASAELARGVYAHKGAIVSQILADAWKA